MLPTLGQYLGLPLCKGFSLALAKKYDLSKVSRVIVGGDGAPWVKEGAELFGGIYELDKFHLKRALSQTLDSELAMEVYQACIRGEVNKADSLLIEVQQKALNEEAKEVARLRGYLMENSFGLRDYRLEVDGDGLRGLGAIEGNVDKLVAGCPQGGMKKRGMSWTKEGANRMAKLISLSHSGKLDTGKKVSTDKPKLTIPRVSHTSEKVEYEAEDGGTWLQVGMPVL